MKRFILLLPLILFLQTLAFSQAPAKYWIAFSDKKGTPYSIERPAEFLSPRAIERRLKFNIPITMQDLPVSPDYIHQVLALDSSMILFTQSKWLNGITVYSEKDSVIFLIQNLPFVTFAEKVITMKNNEPPFSEQYQYYNHQLPQQDTLVPNNIDYGKALEQITLNNVHWLHRLGFKGEKIILGILDGGFLNVDMIPHFELMRNENRLFGARNFVQPAESPFRSGSHGNNVLSCIASYLPGEHVGTAPLVSVWLALTEDGRSENKIEEDNWVAGLEWLDSAGCDVVNSSLGYTKFDDTTQIRKYEDLTGIISRASQAASIAASKGIVVCNSAGNEGSNRWHYIGSPADANDIITVGAVDNEGNRAPFSSYGPTADKRTKPDAATVGFMTYVANPRGKTIRGNGTSYSSPLMAGMVACLREAFPDKNAYEIINAIRMSGSQFYSPNFSLGYGITDMLKAYNILYNNLDTNNLSNIQFNSFVCWGNKIALTIHTLASKKITVKISLQSNPQKIIRKNIILEKGDNIILLSPPKLPKNKAYDFLFIDIDDLHFTLGMKKKKKNISREQLTEKID